LGAEASRVRRSALRVSPTAAGGGEEVTPACCQTAFISPSYRPPACAQHILMTPSLALYVMAQSPAMHEMTQSLAMRVMTQSLAMHVMTLGQTVCGQQVDRQHQDLCTVHALTWQMGHQSQACEQSKAGAISKSALWSNTHQTCTVSMKQRTLRITFFALVCFEQSTVSAFDCSQQT